MGGGGLDINSLDARIEELRRAGDVEALGAEARSSDIATARRAVEALGYLGSKAVAQIRQALGDPRPEVRQHAATAYARAADPEEAAPLAEIARTDESPVVRASALTALGRAGIYSEMETLLAGMNDKDTVVRRRAAAAVTLILGRKFPYNPDSSPAQRLKAIGAIRRFWTRTKGTVGEYYDKNRKRRKEAADKSR